jgi:hypothetical protein
MYFTINDLITAYKKAKSEVFHEKLQVSILAFPEYEKDLMNNLQHLLNKLNSDNTTFVTSDEFSNSNTYYPIVKKIEIVNEEKQSDKNVYYSSLKSRWKNKKYNIQNIDFRIISSLNVEFHIISSLWIDHVAYRFERRLSKNSYGSRLIDTGEAPSKKVGHFKPYIHDYRIWQKNGLDCIREKLENSEEVVALTADIKSFYHFIDIGFIQSKFFTEGFGPFEKLSDREAYLTKILVNAVRHWSKTTYSSLSDKTASSFIDQNHVGIPIGLAASKVIANLVLKEFDEAIEQELLPLYYGRYVDDIFVVLAHNPKIKSRKTLWEFISERVKKLVKDREEDTAFKFQLANAQNTKIIFNAQKERIFFLDTECGISIVNEIEKELNENSSEWRMLPDSENDLDRFSDEVLNASTDANESVNSLRKSDGISIQRLKYALFVRSAEELVLTHPYYFWKYGLQELFKVTANFIVDPDVLPNYLQYIGKILRLATYNCDFKNFKRIWTSLDESINFLDADFLNDQQEEVDKYRTYIRKTTELALHSGGSLLLSQGKIERFSKNIEELININISRERIDQFFVSDMHLVSLKSIFDKQQSSLKNYFKKVAIKDNLRSNFILDRSEIDVFASTSIEERLQSSRQILGDFIYDFNQDVNVPIGLFLPTRKINYLEISRFLDNWLFEQNKLFNSFLSLYELPEFSIPSGDGPNDYKYLYANNFPYKNHPTVAITSYEVLNESWVATVRGTREPDGTRLKRLYSLINNILSNSDKKIDYIVLPELSVPQYAINMISRQINGSGITLITGVDYLIDRSDNTARNIMCIVLPVTYNGRTHVVQLVQEKLLPAIHEGSELYDIARLRLAPINKHKYIISKNGFMFSGLICNDFLNIDNRQNLRGKIDALFLIEWNQDIETYNSLVESTANDLHSFIIQVNNRAFGDTRIRAPYKQAYKRDIARIRGGILDYFIMSQLDVKSLRTFQMNHISPDGPFKPVPTGYTLDERRKLR